jgi:hypothetical protein
VKYKRIEIPIYEQAVHLMIVKDRSEVFKKIKKLGLQLEKKGIKHIQCKNSVGVACELFHENEFDSLLMWLPKFTGTASDWNNAAHEICHIKNFLWAYIGLKKQVPTKVDEVEAYLVGWLTEQFVHFVRS